MGNNKEKKRGCKFFFFSYYYFFFAVKLFFFAPRECLFLFRVRLLLADRDLKEKKQKTERQTDRNIETEGKTETYE